jgi:hypothetical protein
LWSENDAITSCLRLISTSHHFINPYETYPKCLSHWYAVSRAYRCTLTPLYWPSWPQIWVFWVTFEKGLMSRRHVWGLYPPQTTSNIHIRHTKCFLHCYAVSRILGAPLYHHSSRVGPIFVELTSLVEWEWCHFLMVEANIHLWLLHTFILDIYKVFEPLVWCLKGIWVHP